MQPPEPDGSSMRSTTVKVLATQALVIAGLWLLGLYFS
jgi:hypothetical protein